jgi:glycosyltransferase involved in cell wall biosynthesis
VKLWIICYGMEVTDAMVNIAILGSRGYPSYYGGFETLVRHLAPYLANHDHAITVYGHDRRQRMSNVSTDEGAEIMVRSTIGIDRKSASTLTYGLTGCIDLARQKYDVALILNVAHGLYLPLLARTGIPTCVNVDGLEWERGKWGRIGRSTFLRGAKLCARHADSLIMDSESLRPIWKERFGRDGQFIPYGAPVLCSVETNRLDALGLPLGRYILAVARIVPENNIDLLLDAVELLPERPEIVVVGDGNYLHPTIERLKSLDDQGRVKWIGRVDDQVLLDQLWAHAGVYWHGHSVGGTNPALLQALGAGAPTIALDTPFNREVLDGGDQLVPHDAGKLAYALKDVLLSSSRAANMTKVGQERIRSKYSWDRICKEYEEVLLLLAERLSTAK